MLNFRKITLEDKPLIEGFLRDNKGISCENTFVNLFVWQEAYNNMICTQDDTLFIKYGDEGDETYRFPIGGDLQEGIQKIFAHCGEKTPVFWSPVDDVFEKLSPEFKAKYNIIPTRDGFDYIYLREDLATLSGKKYHSKRNHISAFSKKYDWHYEDITPKNLDAVRLCANRWYNANADRADKYMHCEKQGVEYMLSHLTELDVTGGAIVIEGEVVAFCLGTPINGEVFDICTEKALPDFATAYTVINCEFARRLTEYKYLNREDDLGLEGLRKAKLSYKPAVLLEKYLFSPKFDTRNLYRQAFGQDSEFENLLFLNAEQYIHKIKENGVTVSALFSLPCKISTPQGELPAEYIFAAATHSDYRRQGYMERLLSNLTAENDKIFILRPANENLIFYYKKFGFTPFTATDCQCSDKALIPLEGFAALAQGTDPSHDGEFTAMSLNSKYDLNGLFFPCSMP